MNSMNGRLNLLAYFALLLSSAACGEAATARAAAPDDELVEPRPWPAATVVARHGVAVLEFGDDEVIFEAVPFEGTLPISAGLLEEAGAGSPVELQLAGRRVSLVSDAGGEELVISSGALRFTLHRNGEEVEFEGRRARLGGGAKRAVFRVGGHVEVRDLE